jgi:hypothetical protein
MEWQKLTTSGSNAHLGALHISGATSTVAEVSNSVYFPDDQYFRLHDFTGGNNESWKFNNINSNVLGGIWRSSDGPVDGVEHKRFDVSGQNLSWNPQSNTGPASGITPSSVDLISPSLAVSQTPNTLYLYTETSYAGEHTYSIVSPLINLTDYSNAKLAFYFYLFGANCGNFKVFTSTSNSSISSSVATQQDISYAYDTGLGFFDLSDPVSQVGYQGDQGSGQTHNDNSSKWYRAEVDLISFTEGYVWIVYESGGSNQQQFLYQSQADFAISNVFLDLDLDNYLIPETEEIDNYELSLKVLGTAIDIYGLPESDPEEEGQLYQDPNFLTSTNGFILISNGPI